MRPNFINPSLNKYRLIFKQIEPESQGVTATQKPPAYQRTGSGGSGGYRGSTLSRQSTTESYDSDTTISQTLNTSASTATQQPIKKSPREFIIPIAVEGGGVVTPRDPSIEPSDTTTTANSSFSSRRLSRPRKLG